MRMNDHLNKTVSTRAVVYSLLAVFAVYAVFFGPGAVQRRNMKRATVIKKQIHAHLALDESYSHITIGASTANLGRNLYIFGYVPNDEKRNLLKDLIETEFQDDVIKILFSVKVMPEELKRAVRESE